MARSCNNFPRLINICLGKRYIFSLEAYLLPRDRHFQYASFVTVRGNIYIYFSDHTVEQLLG